MDLDDDDEAVDLNKKGGGKVVDLDAEGGGVAAVAGEPTEAMKQVRMRSTRRATPKLHRAFRKWSVEPQAMTLAISSSPSSISLNRSTS
jgi:hypothetical protein